MTPTQTNTDHPVPAAELPSVVVPAEYPHHSESAEESVSLLDLALVLAARKWFIILFTLAATIITALITLILPFVFTATTTMLPPQQASSASALLGSLGGLASLAGGGGGGAASMLGLKNPADLYIGLLQSATVEDGLIRRFHLMQLYRTKFLVDTRNVLKSNTKIAAEKSSLISISVKDKDPKRAAALANGYVEELHKLMSHLAVTDAAQRRMFFEQQLEGEKNKLADAEVALEVTERKTGIIQPQGQAAVVIGTIAQLRAQISADEVELAALRTSATDQNSDVVTLQSQIQGLRAQLADFEKGHPGATASVLTPTSQLPAASLEYIRRMRDVKYYETLFTLLARQYEMAKVDEAKEGQMIQVVDPALVPERRSWPPRTLLTMVAFVLAAGLSSLWVVLQAAYRSKMRDPDVASKTEQLKAYLRIRRTNHV
jgi:tyrosine-protein kinase Etk/Wzc